MLKTVSTDRVALGDDVTVTNIPEYAFDLYDTLAAIVSSRHVTHYLEIGVNFGVSLRCVLKHTSGLDRITLIDAWNRTYGGACNDDDHIMRMLTKRGFDMQAVTSLTGDSHLILPDLDGTFDLILVDGDHSFAGCWADMVNAWDHLAVGGSMLVDDVTHPSHSYLLECCQRFATDYDVEGIAVTRKRHGVAVFKKEAP